MFPWFAGRGNNEENEDIDAQDEREFLPYAMDMDYTGESAFSRPYRAFSSERLPESNLREQLEYGGKSTSLLFV
jgi:hypothetical protein